MHCYMSLGLYSFRTMGVRFWYSFEIIYLYKILNYRLYLHWHILGN